MRPERFVMLKTTIERLGREAEKIRNTDPVDLANMEIGEEHRQGDLRIIRLEDDFTEAHSGRLKQVENPPLQLAPGTTQGSRHELLSLEGITSFRLIGETELDGPVIKSDLPFSIVHPEHGDAINIPPGCYAFPGQRAFAETLQRTQD